MINTDEEVFKLFNEAFLTILDRINEPIIVINKEGIVVYVNSAYEYQIGISREKILNKNISEKYPNDKLLYVLKTGKQIQEDEHYNETLGFDIVASFIPLKDSDGQIKGVIGVGNTGATYKLNKHLRSLVIRKDKKTTQKENRKNLRFFQSIVSEDPKMLKCLNMAFNVAKTEASVMLRGETGSGKELIAQGIHKASNRANCPFVEINCAAIPETLLESELFGYSPGAFTGAKSTGKTGKFEEANNGTLFLDEIGDIPCSTQVKLLRFTQERYIEKLGDNKKIPVNVRIISATNRNLEQMVQQGLFRADLYYRLYVVPIFIPPLRQRIADISLLTYHFLNYFTKKYNKSLRIAPDTIKFMQDYPWPGNIRELKNTIEHAVIMCQTDEITKDDLQLSITSSPNKPEFNTLHLNQAIEDLEKTLIKEALDQAKNNKSKAIDYLGISRSAFYAKLEKYNIL